MTDSPKPEYVTSDGSPRSAASRPTLSDPPDGNAPTTVAHETPDSPSSGQFITRARASTSASLSNATNSFRRGTMRILEADLPPGMWGATANVTSQAPTLGDIRSGRVGREGSDLGEEIHGHLERRRSTLGSSKSAATPGAGSRRSRTRTDSSLSMGTPKTGTKRQGSFGFRVGTKASREDAGATLELSRRVREHDEADHGIVEEMTEEPNQGMAETKKTPLTEEELAQVCKSLLSQAVTSLQSVDTCVTAANGLYRASKTSMDRLNHDRSQGLLEMVHYARGISHHTLRSQCGRLGRHAFSASL